MISDSFGDDTEEVLDMSKFAPESDTFWEERHNTKPLPGKLGEATFWEW